MPTKRTSERNAAFNLVPGLASLGAFAMDVAVHPAPILVALSAADLRWERLAALLLLTALATGVGKGPVVPHQRGAGAARLGLLAWVDAAAHELAWETPPPTAPLWGAPFHVGVAVFCAQAALVTPTLSGASAITTLGAGSAALAALGLVWNNTQAGGAQSWTWDWIEAAPPALAAGAVSAGHGWSRCARNTAWLTYLAALQLSRASLLASTHHLQPPQAGGVGPLGGWYVGWPSPGAAGGLWAACIGAGLGWRMPGPRWLSLVSAQTPRVIPRLWRYHLVTAAATASAWAPLWTTCSAQGAPGTGWPEHLMYAWGGAALPALRLRQRQLRDQMLVIWRWPSYTFRWHRGTAPLLGQLGLLWANARPNRHSLGAFFRYSMQIVVPYFRPTSVFGFSLLVAIYVQMYSGLLLALYYLPDPTFVIPIREDLFMEVWWFPYVYKAHVLGVDILFTLSYMHILKKFYLKNYAEGDLDGWFTGAYAFLVYHLVVFLGITLSTNHLGDVTIMIAANIYWSLFFRWHKVYAPFFTNKHLSTDQLTRFMIAHYISAWYYTYLVQAHVVFIHEMWDASANRSTQQTTSTPKGSWVWDALKKEVMTMFALYKTLAVLYFFMLHPDAHVVNYSFFEQWSETEMEEVNFFIVAPHWYFRPHMGLLTVCAHHYEGLAWFVAFYLLLCYTPHLYRLWNRRSRVRAAVAESTPVRQSWIQELLYVGFFGSILYVGGTLPCGRFYYENIDGFFGNFFLRLSYEYIYLYLGLLAHMVEQLERRYAGGAATHQLASVGRQLAAALVRSRVVS